MNASLKKKKVCSRISQWHAIFEEQFLLNWIMRELTKFSVDISVIGNNPSASLSFFCTNLIHGWKKFIIVLSYPSMSVRDKSYYPLI